MSQKNEHFAKDKASLNEEKIETIINIIGGVTAILMYVNLRIFVLFY